MGAGWKHGPAKGAGVGGPAKGAGKGLGWGGRPKAPRPRVSAPATQTGSSP
jgi:hypothetical protein